MVLIQTLALFSLLIITLVFVHELGHYVMAKILNIKVEEFSIGFGKTIVSKKDKYGTLWKLSFIPLGGYCKMLGDSNASSFGAPINLTDEEKKISLYYAPAWKKFFISIGGPLFNFIFAALLFAGIYSFSGKKMGDITIKDIIPASLSQQYDIRRNDQMLMLRSYNNVPVDPRLFLSCNEKIKQFKVDVFFHKFLNQDNFILYVKRNKKILKKEINKLDLDKYKYQLGIHLECQNTQHLKYPFYYSIIQGVYETYNTSKIMLMGIYFLLFKGSGFDSIGGPIKIAELSGQAGSGGIVSFLSFMILISINLGLFNLFPIPMLDGGMSLTSLIEFIIRRRLSDKFYKFFGYIGYVILGSLMILGFGNDIYSLIKNYVYIA